MCKIPQITTLIIILLLCVSCKHAIIDTTDEAYSETYIQTTPEPIIIIDQTFNIGLPDKSVFTPYTIPDIVAKNEFEHSEYALMVRAAKHTFTAEMIEMYNYAFLDENTDNFEEGNEIYNKLDSIYSKQYPYIDLPETYFYGGDDRHAEALKDYFFKKSIVFVSSDGKKVICQSLLFGGVLTSTGYKDMIIERNKWNKLIEIYDGKESVYEKMYEDDSLDGYMPNIYDFYAYRSVFDLNGFMIDENIIIDYINQTEKNVYYGDHNSVFHIPNTTNKYLKRHRTIYKDEISIHNLSDGKQLATLTIPNHSMISHFTNDERIVVVYQLKIPSEIENLEDFYTEENIYSNDTYIMNIDGSDAEYLGNYMFNPYMSPDGKYIAYTGMSGTDHQEYTNEYNNMAELKDGFYIKNLETNQTIFYPVENAYEYNIVGWVSKNGLDNLLN